MPRTIDQARRRLEAQQAEAARIAEEQAQRSGYRRTPGFDPAPKPRRQYFAEADRVPPAAPGPAGLSSGVLSTPEQEKRRRKQRVFTNADL